MSKNKIEPTEPIEPIELKLDFSIIVFFLLFIYFKIYFSKLLNLNLFKQNEAWLREFSERLLSFKKQKLSLLKQHLKQYFNTKLLF